MLRADSAKMKWDPDKKRWHVDIQIGAEVIKRPLTNDGHETADDALRSRAVEIAKDEGYELETTRVAIVR